MTADWMDLYLKSPTVMVTWERYTASATCVHCFWVLHLTKGAGRLPARARTVRVLRTPGKALPVEELRMPLCRHHAQEWSARDLDPTPPEENP